MPVGPSPKWFWKIAGKPMVTQGRMCPCNSIQINPEMPPKATVASHLPSSFGATIFFYHWIRHRNRAVVLRTAEIFSMASWGLGSVALKVSICWQGRDRGEFGELQPLGITWRQRLVLVVIIWELLFSQQISGKRWGVKGRIKTRQPGCLF